jgi:LysM repeat protein
MRARRHYTPVRYNDSVRLLSFLAIVMAAACSPLPAGTPPAVSTLRPYPTATPSATLDGPVGLISAETPPPSPTPTQYTIKSGDTLSQLAERYRITLDALLAANPGINPNALRVGDTLRIPSSPADRAIQTPTPAPIAVTQISCHPTANGAVWCFVLVRNDTPDIIENITALVSLVDKTGALLDSRDSVLPLDILRPGTSLPISALFPPPLPLEVEPQVRMLTGISLLPGDQRYLPAEIGDTRVEVSSSGLSAYVTGQVSLPADSKDATQVWIVAVAYDADGNLVGWRRWESLSAVAAGSHLPFELTVSSVAGSIDRVEFAVQARP